MLASAIEFLENLPSEIIELKLMKRDGNFVYTIFAKTGKGIETFQLRGSSLYHFNRNGKEVIEELLFKFYEKK